MSIEDIMNDIENKAAILNWMKKNNVKSIDKIGSIMAVFYKNPEKVIKAARANKKPEMIL